MAVGLKARDFAVLEGIRGLAALYVVLNHARGHAWAGVRVLQANGAYDALSTTDKVFGALNQLTRLGHEAVIVFFVLSGFSIAHSLSGPVALPRFYARRLLRLYPPKALALGWAIAVFLVTRAWTPDLHDASLVPWNLASSANFVEPWVILKNLAYMPSGALISQYWSLPQEMIFYALAPFLISRTKWFFTFAGLAFLVGLVGPWTYTPKPSTWLLYVFQFQFFFAIGALLYTERERVGDWVRRVPLSLRVLFLGAIFVALEILSTRQRISKGSEVLAALAAVVLICTFLERQIHGKILGWLGERSYSLYLTHVATIILGTAAIHVCTGNFRPIVTPYAWVLLLPFCLLVAEATFLLVEEPSRRWVSSLRGKGARPVTSAPTSTESTRGELPIVVEGLPGGGTPTASTDASTGA